METLRISNGLGKWAYLCLTLMTGLLVSCGDNLDNIYRENLTLKEAQKLVTFQICVPSYIPAGIDSNPNIINQAEGPDIIPEENYIRLQYKRVNDQKKAFEVFERFTSYEEFKLPIQDDERNNIREASKVDLLYWMTKSLSESEINTAVKQMVIKDDILQTGKVVWFYLEIVDPEKYHSTKTYWVNNHVEYRILSYLPAEEIKAITQSMINCSTP
jgi:hypothetical protein